MSPSSKYFRLLVSFLSLQLTRTQSDAKHRFCSQPYFDAVFFDGHSYRFVVSQPWTKEVNSFAVSYDSVARRFTNFTHFTQQINRWTYILQGGFHNDELYVQFYYRDPVGYEDDADQMDYRAYELQYCETQSTLDHGALFDAYTCSRKKSSTLLSPQITTAFTTKHRLYFFDPKSRYLWALLHQNPPYYGWIHLDTGYRAFTDVRKKWEFRQSVRNREYFPLWTATSNVVRRLMDLTPKKLSISKLEIPINQFFNCGTVDSPNLDQRMVSLTQLMLISTSVLAALLVLAIICTCTVFYENKRIFKRIIEMLQSRQPSSSPSPQLTSFIHQ
ncbi:hypothetical protein TYRP_012970 [Tyrophagus putrescentiae]|nr:hypothetical protein TYRP_012970 [Tyrophagus putrescentiae]